MPLSLTGVTQYVEENISHFHERRIAALERMDLEGTLRKKNPYLYRSKNIRTSGELVKGITDAFVSSQEETIFGDWLEGLALFVNQKAYGGWKSGIDGIDIEFDKDDTRYIVTVKSGPKWSNASQLKKLRTDFNAAKIRLRTSRAATNVVAVNGCCYGRDRKPDKGDYFKYCGQQFWEFISGDPNMYLEIIEPLGHKAHEKNEEFFAAYAKIINRFDAGFLAKFCNPDGSIKWDDIVRLNSKR